MHYIPLGYDPTCYGYSDERRWNTRRELGFLDDDIVAIYSGKIRTDKGIVELLEAISVLLERCPKLRFVFAGGGEKDLERRIEEEFPQKRVKLLGFKEQAELGDLFCAADFGIWPQHISISHIEATGCHLPLIVSNHPDCEERVEEGNGQRLAECSVEQICDAVSFYVENPDALGNHRRKAAELAERLTWDRINDSVMELIDSPGNTAACSEGRVDN